MIRKRVKSFKYAFEGVLHTLVHEVNFRIQLLFTVFAVWLGFFFEISHTDWGLLIISSGLLLSAELLNTVVENFTDHFFKEIHPTAKILKDVSAGFVLITAITALSIFLLIFSAYF